MFHECAAKINDGDEWAVGEIPPDTDATEYQRAALEQVLYWWQDNFGNYTMCSANEVAVEVITPGGIKIIGRIDGEARNPVNGTLSIIERKYAKVVMSGFTQRRQLSFYFAGKPEAETCEMQILSKPTIKPKKDETVGAFASRVEDWIQKKDAAGELVKIKEYHRAEFPIKDELEGADVAYEMIQHCTKRGLFPANYGMSCDMCDIRTHCRDMLMG